MSLIYRSILVASLLLTGCSDDVDIYQPDPLVDIDNAFETEVLWSTEIGDGATDTTVKIAPTYAYNKIFAADNSGNVVAIEPKNGKIIWQKDLELKIGGGPAVANNMVVVGSQRGEVVALDAASGEIKWQSQVSSEIISSPAVGEGYVVVNTVDGKITALDAESGEEKWFYDQSIPSLTLRGNSAPVIAGGGAISGFSNGKLAVFLLQNGVMAWEKAIASPIGNSEIQRLVDVDIKPLVIGSTIYVAAYNGSLMSLDARNGQVIWQRELSTFQEISLSDLMVLVTHENSYVSAINRSNGVSLWNEKSLHRRQLTAPVMVGDYVVVADFEGYLHWLSRADGTVKSREEIDSDGISLMPLVIGEQVILQSHGGMLYAVKKAD
jgi:outer membrane protein assembly factor BamB